MGLPCEPLAWGGRVSVRVETAAIVAKYVQVFSSVTFSEKGAMVICWVRVRVGVRVRRSLRVCKSENRDRAVEAVSEARAV